ncbi:MAG: DUF1570 domain-containing protein [Planctomycetales bacterium]|nr:DUF1570 domain-containing protein [Planctomycetales bacterium]
MGARVVWPASRGAAMLAACLAVGFATTTFAQTVDPRAFGFELQPGKITSGGDRRVVTVDADGSTVVAKVHVHVGDGAIVLLPDGSLVAREARQLTATERPFEPATMEALAERILAHELPGFRSQQTRRFLYLYNTSEPFALATSRVMETMFPGVVTYAQSQKIDVHPPETPLVVVMFRTEDEFQNYRRMPPGVIAYYDTLSNRVVMYEQSRLADVKPELALQQSLATIAHEGAHQILNNIGVQQRLSVWPMWLCEGLAEFFAPTSTDKRLKWKGAGQVNDLRMFELEQYIKGNTSPDNAGKMVEHTVLAGRLTSTGYATAWALTHYLAKNHRESFHEFVREISCTGPFEGGQLDARRGIVPEQLRAFQQHFGEDSAAIESRVVAHLKKLPYRDPFAEWPHFVALVAYPNGRKKERQADVFHSSSLAEQWQRDVLSRLDESVRGVAQSVIRPFPNRAAAEVFVAQWLNQR